MCLVKSKAEVVMMMMMMEHQSIKMSMNATENDRDMQDGVSF